MIARAPFSGLAGLAGSDITQYADTPPCSTLRSRAIEMAGRIEAGRLASMLGFIMNPRPHLKRVSPFESKPISGSTLLKFYRCLEVFSPTPIEVALTPHELIKVQP